MADAVSPRLIVRQTSDWLLALSVVRSSAMVESRTQKGGCVTAPYTGAGRAQPRFVPVIRRANCRAKTGNCLPCTVSTLKT